MISDPGDHHVFPNPDPLHVELTEPKGSPTNPYITGRQVAAIWAIAALLVALLTWRTRR